MVSESTFRRGRSLKGLKGFIGTPFRSAYGRCLVLHDDYDSFKRCYAQLLDEESREGKEEGGGMSKIHGVGSHIDCKNLGGEWDGDSCYKRQIENKFGATEYTGEINGGSKASLKEPKLPLDLINPQATACEARVMAHGKKKYAAHNWMKGLPISEILAAIERHTLAIKRGEDFDPETGEPHECHIRCEAAFLNWFLHGPRAAEYKKFDDRVFKDAVDQ